ncbi:hypothetical protein [Chitinivibrio alkaliphilus]|uniref:Uncharacterized protein n=1 Tax=Chitinivibrio alkaliphilus ACht1 TaxID=1313304 RepID=U7D9R4_9BACT|nr:hypothetical protein [Chitinivibrio alkaliphilus]ERP31160.1 hypothetical protein CALK_1959 [Chitinivibrio alkaliphilus ACht1]
MKTFLTEQAEITRVLCTTCKHAVYLLYAALFFTLSAHIFLWQMSGQDGMYWFLYTHLYVLIAMAIHLFTGRNLPHYYLRNRRTISLALFLLFCTLYLYHYLFFVTSIVQGIR